MCISLYPPLYTAAPDNVSLQLTSRVRYIVLPNRNSSRDIELSCPITPGVLNERYSVVWQASNSGGGFTTLADSRGEYNLSVTVNSSPQPKYQCRVSIQHRSDQVATQDYHGPEIIINRKGELW